MKGDKYTNIRLNNISYYNLNEISFDDHYFLHQYVLSEATYSYSILTENKRLDVDICQRKLWQEEQKKKLNQIDNHYINFPMSYLKGDMIHLTLDNMTGILPKKTFESEEYEMSRMSDYAIENEGKRNYSKSVKAIERYADSKANSLKWQAIEWAEKQISSMIKSRFTLSINISNSRSRYYERLVALVKKTVKNSYKYIEKSNGIETLRGNVLINTHSKCFIFISIFGTDIVDEEFGKYTSGANVYIFGPNAKNIYKIVTKFLNAKIENKRSGTIRTYNIVGSGDSWTSYRNDINTRSFDTVFLNDGLEDEIKDFVKTWEEKEEMFAARGLVHKTGILIHGKAGTGKTTIAKTIASEFGYNLINIASTDFDKIDTVELSEAINNEAGRHIIFIDEIDTIFQSRDDELTDDQAKRTTKLLTFLDGITSPNHSIFIATTNYYKRLDSAVTRKGRFDKIVELTDLDRETATRMCKSFELDDEAINKILSASKYTKIKSEHRYNPAELQSDIVEVMKNS